MSLASFPNSWMSRRPFLALAAVWRHFGHGCHGCHGHFGRPFLGNGRPPELRHVRHPACSSRRSPVTHFGTPWHFRPPHQGDDKSRRSGYGATLLLCRELRVLKRATGDLLLVLWGGVALPAFRGLKRVCVCVSVDIFRHACIWKKKYIYIYIYTFNL